MNHKNERIAKLARQGLSAEQIARKLGLPNTERVEHGLTWLREHGDLPPAPKEQTE